MSVRGCCVAGVSRRIRISARIDHRNDNSIVRFEKRFVRYSFFITHSANIRSRYSLE